MKMQFKQVAAAFIATAMLVAATAGCAGSGNTPAPGSSTPAGSASAASSATDSSYPIKPEELGSGTVKWSETDTSDGWTEVTNEGGVTLGYTKASGVSLIQVEGFAFKDLNRNGGLDLYEDWRQDADSRARDLAAQMSGEEIVPLVTHGGWESFGNEVGEADMAYINKGGRDGVTRSSSYEGSTKMAVTWTNALQAVGEAEGGYGIPMTISVDPHNISNTIDQLGLAATMNTELAHAIGVETAKEYRAVGITMLLGPQVDLISTPVFNRGNAAYSEDPALARDIVQAFVDGLQSTYDAGGNDLGWGNESVIAITKHYAGAGAAEGGRNDHDYEGKYTVYPGNSFDAHLIPFFDGAFKLPGKTSATGGIMTNYAISYSDDGTYGELVGGAYSEFKLNLLKESGYDGMIMTDWGILTPPGESDWTVNWGVEDLTTEECFLRLYKLGISQVGGSLDIDQALGGYQMLIDELGEDAALEIIRLAGQKILFNKFAVGIFDNPYITTENAVASVWSDASKAFGDKSQQQAVVMLKNEGNIIGGYDASAEKPTAYIPYYVKISGSAWTGFTYTCEPATNLELASKYYNVVTDTLGEPTGEDADGNKVYVTEDIIRADAKDIATCDFAIVQMIGPYTLSAYDAESDTWFPPSIQYEEYTANSDSVRKESISGGLVEKEMSSVYGTVKQMVKENRSYYGNTSARPLSYPSYETLKFVAEAVPDDCKVIVSMELTHGAMVWSEVEPLADVILARYKDGAIFVGESQVSASVIMEIIVGDVEPNGLLPVQQPMSMEAVEKQLEDVPRDTECYVDSAGNTYDFAFGLNWAGVINDARTAKYKAPPLTKPE